MKWPWQKEQAPMQIGEIQAELDESSKTWMFVKQYVDREIASLRERNDSSILDQNKTAHIRGQIEALKQLAELPKKNRETASRPALIAGRN